MNDVNTRIEIDAKQAAAGLLLGRLVAGTALTLVPGLAARVWVGPIGATDAIRPFARVIGLRDLLLAATAIAADSSGTRARSLRMEAATDAGDTVALVLSTRHLTPWRRVLLPVVSGGSAAFAWWLAGKLD